MITIVIVCFTLPLFGKLGKDFLPPEDKGHFIITFKTPLGSSIEYTNNRLREIEKILKKTRANLLWAKNGKEAVETVRRIDGKQECMVIMDIKMPVMNGIRAANEIYKINPAIPVIAVTAYAQTQNREKILKENFVDYIAKPLKPELLIEALRNHMI